MRLPAAIRLRLAITIASKMTAITAAAMRIINTLSIN
jgi:hypothetical protein